MEEAKKMDTTVVVSGAPDRVHREVSRLVCAAWMHRTVYKELRSLENFG